MLEAFPTLTAFLHLRTMAGQSVANFAFGWIYHASAITLAVEWGFISDVMSFATLLL